LNKEFMIELHRFHHSSEPHSHPGDPQAPAPIYRPTFFELLPTELDLCQLSKEYYRRYAIAMEKECMRLYKERLRPSTLRTRRRGLPQEASLRHCSATAE